MSAVESAWGKHSTVLAVRFWGKLVQASTGEVMCTIAGLVLFGIKPRRYLRQAGIRVMVFDGEEKTY